MNNFDRFRLICYIRPLTDVLHAKVNTIGLTEMVIDYKDLQFRFMDPKTHYPGSRRWLHHFQDVGATLYFIDLSAYDQGEKDSNKLILLDLKIFA